VSHGDNVSAVEVIPLLLRWFASTHHLQLIQTLAMFTVESTVLTSATSWRQWWTFKTSQVDLTRANLWLSCWLHGSLLTQSLTIRTPGMLSMRLTNYNAKYSKLRRRFNAAIQSTAVL